MQLASTTSPSLGSSLPCFPAPSSRSRSSVGSAAVPEPAFSQRGRASETEAAPAVSDPAPVGNGDTLAVEVEPAAAPAPASPVPSAVASARQKPPLRARTARLGHFNLLCMLGRGAYGRVLQVRHVASGDVLAMKVFDKKQLVRQKQVDYTRVERDIMTRISHPFLVDLKFCFQTDAKLYLVMDFLGGGELFTHIQSKKLLRESEVRLFAAEILLALEHLHNLNIVHRDLKPENVLLDGEGHVKLTDYGLSKAFEGDGVSTRTVCGTNEYMAPEMLAGGGYGMSVDWWSYGALLYEMLTGDAPFVAKDKKKLRDKILHDRGLLERNVEKRLGCGKSTLFKTRGVAELKQHAFFKPLDWRKVERREYPMPIPIAMTSETDTSNFSAEMTCLPVEEAVKVAEKKDAAPTPTLPELDTIDVFRGFSFTHADYVDGMTSPSMSCSLVPVEAGPALPHLDLGPVSGSEASLLVAAVTLTDEGAQPSPPALSASFCPPAVPLVAPPLEEPALPRRPPGLAEPDPVGTSQPSSSLVSAVVEVESPPPASAVTRVSEVPCTALSSAAAMEPVPLAEVAAAHIAPEPVAPAHHHTATPPVRSVPSTTSTAVPGTSPITPVRRLALAKDAPEWRPLSSSAKPFVASGWGSPPAAVFAAGVRQAPPPAHPPVAFVKLTTS